MTIDRLLRGGEAEGEYVVGRGFGGDAVAVGDVFAGNGGHALSGDDDADEVKRVGGGECDEFFGGLLFAGGAEGFDGNGESELFAEEAVDEASATDFATVFEATEAD